MIRNHEAAIADLSKTRTKIFVRLWKRRTPYKIIADVCGVSEQTVYNMLRDTKVIEEKKILRAEKRKAEQEAKEQRLKDMQRQEREQAGQAVE